MRIAIFKKRISPEEGDLKWETTTKKVFSNTGLILIWTIN